ncbi:MAG: hypothetical protein J7K98_03740 [Candidatus Aenigmarchaeota archaeon]|nr:hypothetical protein [Candidatus Aenigmarchaeota archaeon]
MGSLKIVMEDELLKEFRKKAMEKFGYTKGALSIAAREAIKNWLNEKVEKSNFRKDFLKTIEEVSGIWESEEGVKYVRKMRKESEKRLKRLEI